MHRDISVSERLPYCKIGKKIVKNKVFILVPTYNRLERLIEFVAQVEVQTHKHIVLVVVEDGCTDGTREYLKTRQIVDTRVLSGDGNLWWGGAINMGIGFLRSMVNTHDFVLIINDDVRFSNSYVEDLVESSLRNSGAVIGSAQLYSDNGQLMMLGYKLNEPHYFLDTVRVSKNIYTEVDAVGGRGVLIPGQCFMKVGFINTKLFKHYLGDIEFSHRMKRMGFNLIVNREVGVYVDREASDAKLARQGPIHKYFHSKSKSNIIHKMCLFFVVSSFKRKLVFPIVYPAIKIATYARGVLIKGSDRVL